MSDDGHSSRARSHSLTGGAALAGLALIAVVTVTILWPAAAVIWPMIRAASVVGRSEPGPLTPGLAVLGLTIGCASLVALLATAVAWPVAWALRTLRPVWALLAGIPMLMPSYLAYAGWGLLRAPGTWLGDWLARGPAPPPGMPPGPNPWPVIAGDVLAFLGLTLWAWPLAAAILTAGARRIDDATLDSLRLEQAPAWRRLVVKASLMRSALLTAAGAVGLVMLGSVIPFHLAQIDVYGTRIWRILDESPWSERWRAYAAAWPVLAVALLAAWLAGAKLTRSRPDLGAAPPAIGSAGRGSLVIGVLIWCASVLGPLALFAFSVQRPRSFITFWAASGAGFSTSAQVAGLTAAIGVLIAGATWLTLSAAGSARTLGTLCFQLFLFAGLVPGVLVGAATAAAWNASGSTRWVGDSILILALSHTARFGFVPALIGWWLARAEPAAQRDLRRIDGADSILGWLAAALPPQAGGLLAAGLVSGCLSFHEIEASVMIQPPGRMNLAQDILSFLHFARVEEMSVAGVYVIGLGLVLALAAAGLLALVGRSAIPPATNSEAGR